MKTNTLTKEQKEAWLSALKSGKYIQGAGKLHDKENNIWCCLGVFADITPTIQINEYGGGCVTESNESSYKPFYDVLREEVVRELWGENDYGVIYTNKRDYSNVIPLIEQLETVD